MKEVTDAADVAQTLIALIREPAHLSSGREVHVGASVGISIFPDDGAGAEQIIRNADTAMYQAKENSRGSFHLYTAAMTRRVEERLEMESRLRRALGENELVLHYQPLVSVADSRCRGLEALVRWKDPMDGSLILPGKFIPLAEETGLILPLGDWVLRAACRQMKTWLDLGLGLDTRAVNLSAAQFKRNDIHKRISACLNETGLAPACLELEITKSAIMEQGSLPEHVSRARPVLLPSSFCVATSVHRRCARAFPPRQAAIDSSFVARQTPSGQELPCNPAGQIGVPRALATQGSSGCDRVRPLVLLKGKSDQECRTFTGRRFQRQGSLMQVNNHRARDR